MFLAPPGVVSFFVPCFQVTNALSVVAMLCVVRIFIQHGAWELLTLSATANRCIPGARAQAAFQLGLLEQEKSKLQREISTWLAKNGQAETRLRMIRERSGVLRKFLDADAASEPVLSGSSAGAKKRRPKPRCHTVTLQY